MACTTTKKTLNVEKVGTPKYKKCEKNLENIQVLTINDNPMNYTLKLNQTFTDKKIGIRKKEDYKQITHVYFMPFNYWAWGGLARGLKEYKRGWQEAQPLTKIGYTGATILLIYPAALVGVAAEAFYLSVDLVGAPIFLFNPIDYESQQSSTYIDWQYDKSSLYSIPFKNKEIILRKQNSDFRKTLQTDEDGEVTINLFNYFPQKPSKTSFQVKAKHAGLAAKKTISYSRYEVANLLQKYSEPCNLVIKGGFSDSSSLIPNKKIDATERCKLTFQVKNKGEGAAYDVQLDVFTQSEHIDIQSRSKDLGTIAAGSSKRFTTTLKADKALKSEEVTIKAETNEARGYNARPLALQIAAQSFLKPKLRFKSCSINDDTGLGQGDGDGTPENNESIELNPYVSNQGKDSAYDVRVKIVDISRGIKIKKKSAKLSSIPEKQTEQSKLCFKIPRTYKKESVVYTLQAQSKRGITTHRIFEIPLNPKRPNLNFSYALLNSQGNEVTALKNGKSYQLKITPKNMGKIYAEDVRLQIQSKSDKVNIGKYAHTIGTLQSKESTSPIIIPVKVDSSYNSQKSDLKIKLAQSDFSDLKDTITFPVKLRSPKLQCRLVPLRGASKESIFKNNRSKMRVVINNKGDLGAQNVQVRLNIPKIDYKRDKTIGSIPVDGVEYTDFQFYMPGNIKFEKLPVKVNVDLDYFPNLNNNFAYNVKKQRAMVKKVKGEGKNKLTSAGFVPAPEIYILNPAKNNTLNKDRVFLHGKVMALGEGNGISKLEVKVNGKQLAINSADLGDMNKRVNQLYKQVNGRKLDFKGRISLQKGKNNITINCIDRNAQKSTKKIEITKKGKLTLQERLARLDQARIDQNNYLFAVGISNYSDAPDVEFGAASAEFFTKAAKKEFGIPPENVVMLIDQEATGMKIQGRLQTILSRLDSNDKLYFYYAGHGVPGRKERKSYLLPQDGVKGSYENPNFALEYFENKLADSDAKKIMMFIDACFSGHADKNDLIFDGVAPAIMRKKSVFATPEKIILFTAGKSTQFANEYEPKKQRLFSYFLVKGLIENMNIQELSQYVQSKVSLISRKKGPDYIQEPQVYGLTE